MKWALVILFLILWVSGGAMAGDVKQKDISTWPTETKNENGNPDGKKGTIWIELYGASAYDGRWEIEEVDIMPGTGEKYRIGVMGTEIGFVASPDLTLKFGLGWTYTRAINAVWGLTDKADQKTKVGTVSLKVKWYLSR